VFSIVNIKLPEGNGPSFSDLIQQHWPNNAAFTVDSPDHIGLKMLGLPFALVSQ
jgi:hypothetical protein